MFAYPFTDLPEDLQGLEGHIDMLADLMERAGMPRNEPLAYDPVATHGFHPEGFRSWKARALRRFFTQELPRRIGWDSTPFTPATFRAWIERTREMPAQSYDEQLLKGRHIIYGTVVLIPGVCDLPEGQIVAGPADHPHLFRHSATSGKTCSGKSTGVVNKALQRRLTVSALSSRLRRRTCLSGSSAAAPSPVSRT